MIGKLVKRAAVSAAQAKYDRIKAKNDAAGRPSGPRPGTVYSPKGPQTRGPEASRGGLAQFGTRAIDRMNDNAGMLRSFANKKPGLTGQRKAQLKALYRASR